MNAILKFKDNQFGNFFIVIPKIREVAKGLGNIIITFDNGDKQCIDTDNSDEMIENIKVQINNFYSKL